MSAPAIERLRVLEPAASRFLQKAKDLRERFSDINDAQVVEELKASVPLEHRGNPGILDQLAEIAVESRRAKFSGKAGKRTANPVRSFADRRRLKNYPDYSIDDFGQLWDAEGKLVRPRWKNQRCWVQIYDHTGKRCERNVYWLMVDAGYLPETRKDVAK